MDHEAKPVNRRTDHRDPAGAGAARTPTADVAASMGSAALTFYEWKAKYGGLEVSDAKWLKVLEDENTMFKTIPLPKTCPETVLLSARTGTLVSSPCRRSAART
jgi:hypothetical protein